MKDRLLPAVGVALVREEHQLAGGAVPLQGAVEALALHGEGARVVVLLPVDQQDGLLDLVRHHERAHLHVRLGCLPHGALLRLEAEGRECAVVGARPRDGAAEQLRRVRQQVGRHERPVRVPPHRNARRVRDSPAHDLLHGGARGAGELLHVGVVGLGVALPDDGHGGTVQHGVPAREVQEGGGGADAREAVRGVPQLPRRLLRLELPRVRPQQRR
mmetsp:Transcript_17321/g.37688  ORF Transcript_17321/g.37688 Transcript_17321/m.37688 type:complete len:216 (-) Transcript_17321:1384-2031(-)